LAGASPPGIGPGGCLAGVSKAPLPDAPTKPLLSPIPRCIISLFHNCFAKRSILLYMQDCKTGVC
jgi:hypothetical protein